MSFFPTFDDKVALGNTSLGPVSLASCHVPVCSLVIQLGWEMFLWHPNLSSFLIFLVYLIYGILSTYFPVIFFSLSDWSEIGCFSGLVYRARSVCRCFSLPDRSASCRCGYSRWHSPYIFSFSARTWRTWKYTVTKHLILILILREPAWNDR